MMRRSFTFLAAIAISLAPAWGQSDTTLTDEDLINNPDYSNPF